MSEEGGPSYGHWLTLQISGGWRRTANLPICSFLSFSLHLPSLAPLVTSDNFLLGRSRKFVTMIVTIFRLHLCNNTFTSSNSLHYPWLNFQYLRLGHQNKIISNECYHDGKIEINLCCKLWICIQTNVSIVVKELDTRYVVQKTKSRNWKFCSSYSVNDINQISCIKMTQIGIIVLHFFDQFGFWMDKEINTQMLMWYR